MTHSIFCLVTPHFSNLLPHQELFYRIFMRKRLVNCVFSLIRNGFYCCLHTTAHSTGITFGIDQRNTLQSIFTFKYMTGKYIRDSPQAGLQGTFHFKLLHFYYASMPLTSEKRPFLIRFMNMSIAFIMDSSHAAISWEGNRTFLVWILWLVPKHASIAFCIFWPDYWIDAFCSFDPSIFIFEISHGSFLSLEIQKSYHASYLGLKENKTLTCLGHTAANRCIK